LSRHTLPHDDTGQRETSAARALSEIRRRGPVARVDLVESLDLSPATVSAAISRLLDAELVEEAAPTASPGRGRPRIQLRLRPTARYVAGAKLSDGAFTVAILDFCGEILSTVTVAMPGGAVATGVMMAALDEALAGALDEAGLAESDLAAFGLGTPGFIEPGGAVCHWNPLLAETPVDLRALLSRRLACPVFIDNDANVATMAELWFGYGRDERDFLVVTVEHGVGLGIVLGGQLFRGARGMGAEFGHMKVQMDGALCRCGQRGCLEAYVADYALMREAGLVVGEGAPEAILDRLAARAKAGDEISASIYSRAGRMLGLGLANLLNLLDPPLIVLSGEHIQNHDLLAAEMERTIRCNTLSTTRPPARIAVHRWGDQLWARGAGALALDGLVTGTVAAELAETVA